jgi:hypothetical protein
MSANSTTPVSPRDYLLEASITALLIDYHIPSLRGVRIEARDRTVVLRGEVNSYYAKQVSQHAAQRLAAEYHVVNEVQVAPGRVVKHRTIVSRAAAGALLLAMALAAGCSRSEPDRVEVHPVTGQVIFDGKPAAGAFVIFHPKQEIPGVPRPSASSDKQGNFTLSTYSAGDGAPQGAYAVTVVLPSMVKKDGEFEPGPNLLPAKVANPDTSPIVAQVAAGANTVPITIKR